MTLLFHRVLEPDLPAWLATGWRVVAVDWPPSLSVPVLLVELLEVDDMEEIWRDLGGES